ncbi:MAG TPA: ATP-grasp domain-containing protein [Metabacillus sp.]|nr:ATP-grasp domain-containing protein [Metabacillus sp.]
MGNTHSTIGSPTSNVFNHMRSGTNIGDETMDTIVFIGCNKSGTSRDALKAATEMGYFTVLYTDRLKFLEQREEFHEVHQLIYKKSLLDKKLIVDDIEKLVEGGKNVKACLSLIDPFVSIAAEVSEELQLARATKEAMFIMENKIMFREKLKHLPYTPQFFLFNKENSIDEFSQLMENSLPLVLKSPKSNGSKDVLFATNLHELKKGLTELNRITTKGSILVEEYIDGQQYLVEIIVYKRKVTIVCVLEQEVARRKRFIVLGYQFPAQLSSRQNDELEDTINTIIKEIGLENGSCHLEFRYVNKEWKLIEINPRISGGAMNKIIYHGTGINFVKEILKFHLGEEPIIEASKNECVYVGYITVETKGILLKVTGKNRAKKYHGVKEVYVKPRKGSILTPPLSMGDRYAYVLATAHSQEEAKQYAHHALKEIKFIIEPL